MSEMPAFIQQGVSDLLRWAVETKRIAAYEVPAWKKRIEEDSGHIETLKTLGPATPDPYGPVWREKPKPPAPEAPR